MSELEPRPSDLTSQEVMETVVGHERLLSLVGVEYVEDLQAMLKTDESLDEDELVGGLMTAAAMNDKDPEEVLQLLAEESLLTEQD